MTGTAASGIDSTVSVIDISRDELHAPQPERSTDQVQLVRRIVDSAALSSKLLIASAGDVRRVDIWRSNAGAVVHSFVEDRDLASPCACASGADAWGLVLDLLAEPPAEGRAPSDPAPTSIRFDGLQHLLDTVVDPTPGALATNATILRTQHPDGSISLIVRVSGAASWWCHVQEGDPFEMSRGNDAQYWADVISKLKPVG